MRQSIFSPEAAAHALRTGGASSAMETMAPSLQAAIRSLDHTVMRCGRVLASQGLASISSASQDSAAPPLLADTRRRGAAASASSMATQ